MGLAVRFINTADRLLTKLDERAVKAVLITKGDKTYDSGIGDFVFEPDKEQELTGVATSYSDTLIANGTVNSGDIKFISTRAVSPSTDDSVRLDGVTYGVVSVTPKNYTGNDLTICYEIQLRK